MPTSVIPRIVPDHALSTSLTFGKITSEKGWPRASVVSSGASALPFRWGGEHGKLRFKPRAPFQDISPFDRWRVQEFVLEEREIRLPTPQQEDRLIIPIRTHRQFEGKIKGVTIKHMRSGKWCAYLLVDDGNAANELPVIHGAVGFDKSVSNTVSFDSERNEVENPYHLSISSRSSGEKQREPSRRRIGSKNRDKQRIKVACTYEKAWDHRNDLQHELSSSDVIVRSHGYRAMRAGNMIQDRRLSRAISRRRLVVL